MTKPAGRDPTTCRPCIRAGARRRCARPSSQGPIRLISTSEADNPPGDSIMKRVLVGLAAVSLLGVAVAFSEQASTTIRPELVITQEGRNPWTRTSLNNDREEFQFAI